MSIESDKLIEDKIKAMNDIANGKMSSNIKPFARCNYWRYYWFGWCDSIKV